MFGTVSCNGEKALTSFKKATSIAMSASLISIDVVNNNDYNISLPSKKRDVSLQYEYEQLRIECIRSSIKGIVSSDVFRNEVLKNIISSDDAIDEFLKNVAHAGVTYATGVLFVKFLLRGQFTLQSLSLWKLLGELFHNDTKTLILKEISSICNAQYNNSLSKHVKQDEVIKCIHWAFGISDGGLPENLAIGHSNQALLSHHLAKQNMQLVRSNNPSIASQWMQMSNVVSNANLSAVRKTIDFAYNNWDIYDFYQKITGSEIFRLVPSDYGNVRYPISFKIPQHNNWKFVGTKDEFRSLYYKKGKIEFSDSKNASEEFDRILKESFAALYPGEEIGGTIQTFKKNQPKKKDEPKSTKKKDVTSNVVHNKNVTGYVEESGRGLDSNIRGSVQSGPKSIKKSDAYNEYEGDHTLNPLGIINAQKTQIKCALTFCYVIALAK